jgi:transcriptional/translational regulatory protein YebC/TACO1
MWRVTSAPTDLNAVRDALDEAGIGYESADLTMVPTSTVEVADVSSAKQVLKLMDVIDDLDDVQDVHANFDIADEVMDAATA